MKSVYRGFVVEYYEDERVWQARKITGGCWIVATTKRGVYHMVDKFYAEREKATNDVHT